MSGSEERGPWLDQALQAYCRTDAYPFHMPGHKRNPAYFWADPSMDITEIDGFDDLHAPDGLIADLQKELAALYGARESFLLVNGSSAGNLAAVLGATDPDDRILVARNCHKSVWNALSLQPREVADLQPGYTGQGLWGRVTPEQVKNALEAADFDIANRPVKAVVITSPTFEGLGLDVPGIAAEAHAHGACLIVDAAHGAHFGLSEGFPQAPTRQGADAVIMSLHKTLPCYGQTAVLHLCSNRMDRDRIARMLGTVQTSSPSYMLMAQAAACVRWLAEGSGPQELAVFYRRLTVFYERMRGLKQLQVMDPEGRDPSKILIRATQAGWTGEQIAAKLRSEYRLEMEMAAADKALALTSVCDTEEGFFRLEQALRQLDAQMQAEVQTQGDAQMQGEVQTQGDAQMQGEAKTQDDARIGEEAVARGVVAEGSPHRVYTPYEAAQMPSEWAALSQAAGRIAAASVMIYPPGIPLWMMGERIRSSQIQILTEALARGDRTEGIYNDQVPVIRTAPHEKDSPEV